MIFLSIPEDRADNVKTNLAVLQTPFRFPALLHRPQRRIRNMKCCLFYAHPT
jgi:hypothetical protein